jgi:hypothetical protein
MVGGGTIFFTIVSKNLVKPESLEPDILVKNGIITYKYFNADVANNFPNMLQVFVLICTLSGALLVPFFYIPPEEGNNERLDSSMLMHNSHSRGSIELHMNMSKEFDRKDNTSRISNDEMYK